jgi:hypothetical protein
MINEADLAARLGDHQGAAFGSRVYAASAVGLISGPGGRLRLAAPRRSPTGSGAAGSTPEGAVSIESSVADSPAKGATPRPTAGLVASIGVWQG